MNDYTPQREELLAQQALFAYGKGTKNCAYLIETGRRVNFLLPQPAVASHACCRYTGCGRLSFLPAPGSDVTQSLAHWLDTLFLPKILERLTVALVCASRSQARELRQLDRELDEVLPAVEREHSRRAGAKLLGRLSTARGLRVVNKFVNWQLRGETPLHFITIYSIQSAAFHVPIRQAVVTYLNHELRAGTGWSNQAISYSLLQNCLQKIARDLDRHLNSNCSTFQEANWHL